MQRLASFDLNTGVPVGSTTLVGKWYNSEYRLFRSAGRRAWGFSGKAGLQLLDLASPAVIAGERKILARNPELGGQIRLYGGSDVYDCQTNTIYVTAGDARIYGINDRQEAFPVAHVPDSPDCGRRVWTFGENWRFYPLEDNLGFHVHRTGAVCSPKSAILLDPSPVRELNPNVEGEESCVGHAQERDLRKI